MDNGNILASNAGSIARLLAGVLGGILTSVGVAADDGALETIIGGILVAVAGIWAIVKNAKAAKATQDVAKKASALVLLLAFGWMLTGCATTYNSTPIMSESNGETVVANAVNIKIGFGSKEATSIGAYKLSADGGLSINNLDSKSDSSQVLLQAITLGTQLGRGYLAAQGIAVPASDASQEPTTAIVPEVLPIASTLKSAISGEGVPIVAILGNRATCSRCVTLWGNLDADALSESLCGASVIDADKTDNPVEYARLRPKEAFAYPLVVVFNADGTRAGQFDARGMTQAQVAEKVKAISPK